jgi:hypothetical protein
VFTDLANTSAIVTGGRPGLRLRDRAQDRQEGRQSRESPMCLMNGGRRWRHEGQRDYYELKHRAIQWMVDPVEDGGLGLDPATAAAMVGHEDGGYLIATVYTKLAQRRALARAQRAMDAYQQRQAAATAEAPCLHAVA